MNRLEAIIAIRALARPTLEQGYYVTSDDGEPDLGADYCYEHATAVADELEVKTGTKTWVASTSMGADGHRGCDFKRCSKHLDFGGLTNEGVRSALGLTESDPYNCSVYPSELALAAGSMLDDDPRWPLWERHAKRILAKYRGTRAERKRRR